MLAPNPSPMTLEGTNTWLLRGNAAGEHRRLHRDRRGSPDRIPPGESRRVGQDRAHPADPRPPRPQRRVGPARRADRCPRARARPQVRRAAGAPAIPSDQCGVHLEMIGTPGHSADSLSFYLPERQRGAHRRHHPRARHHGRRLARRRSSAPTWRACRRLREYGDAAVLPGHGPELPSAGRVAEDYLAHREERLAQVAKAVADGARTPREVVEIVYVDVPRCCGAPPSSRCVPSSTTWWSEPVTCRPAGPHSHPGHRNRRPHGRGQPRGHQRAPRLIVMTTPPPRLPTPRPPDRCAAPPARPRRWPTRASATTAACR